MKAHELPEAGKYCFLNKTILAEGHFCDTGWNPENGPSAGAAGVGWGCFPGALGKPNDRPEYVYRASAARLQ